MATSNTPFPCSLLVQSRQHRCSTQSMFALYLLKLQQHDNLRHSLRKPCMSNGRCGEYPGQWQEKATSVIPPRD